MDAAMPVPGGLFGLSEEQAAIRQMARDFAAAEITPYAMEWDQAHHFAADVVRRAAGLGMCGIYVREDAGGSGLSRLDGVVIMEELARGCPSTSAYISINNMVAGMIDRFGDARQRAEMLPRLCSGEWLGSYCLTEPGSGSDAAALRTSARLDGDGYVLNGTKQFISGAGATQLYIVMARTGEGKRAEGVTAFIVERGTRGFIIEREIPMLGGQRTYELVFEDCVVSQTQVLGEVGRGYAPMQLRLNVRRLQMGARCIGIARRALDMMCEHVKQRSTFGVKLADRQAIQWWIADAATRIHACRLMVQAAARTLDSGGDVRLEASMIKVFATEMATEVVDQAMQSFGAMGMTKETPLQLFAQQVRLMRIYEGPTEVHRMSIARQVLKGSK